MAFEVEQVDKFGNIVIDYDSKLSISEIYDVLERDFPGIYKEEGNICGEYNGVKYAIRIKNITYLGWPHDAFKKRIQISDDLQRFYRWAKDHDKVPILMGIYSYDENIVFCDFNIEDYINKKAHNSSAHIYTSDLAAATTDGFFQKVDYFKNRITAFNREGITAYFEDFLENRVDVSIEPDFIFSNEEIIVDIDNGYSEDTVSAFEKVKDNFASFFKSIEPTWDGIECYKEMIAADYKNKYQAEWAGFYLEYIFSKYIEDNDIDEVIQFAQDKTAGGIDLDLYFPELDSYGDLKAHSGNSGGIQGNDWATIMDLINKENGHVYYIVCEHTTEKDKDNGHRVTKYWNTVLNKPNLMSYGSRMKSSVHLKRVFLLDINSNNKQYLTMYRQGINSNGKPREPKIMIEMDKLEYFSKAEVIIEG